MRARRTRGCWGHGAAAAAAPGAREETSAILFTAQSVLCGPSPALRFRLTGCVAVGVGEAADDGALEALEALESSVHEARQAISQSVGRSVSVYFSYFLLYIRHGRIPTRELVHGFIRTWPLHSPPPPPPLLPLCQTFTTCYPNSRPLIALPVQVRYAKPPEVEKAARRSAAAVSSGRSSRRCSSLGIYTAAYLERP